MITTLLRLFFSTIFLLLSVYSFSQAIAPSIEWQKKIGGSKLDRSTSIQSTIDGGYIFAGYSESSDGDIKDSHGSGDYLVVKLNNSGNIQWQKCFGGSSQEFANCIQVTKDGGYIVSGYSFSNNGDVTGNHGSSDCWIVKLSSTGEIQWQKSLGGSNEEGAYYIIPTSDGGYIAAGYTFSNNGDVSGNHGLNDCWIIKLDEKGDMQWQKCLGGTRFDVANSICQTFDGGYIVAGYSQSFDGDITTNHGFQDAWIIKLSRTGNIEWQKCFGGSEVEIAISIQTTFDGGYIFTGFANSKDGDVQDNHGSGEFWVVKIDKVGNIQWTKCLGGSGEDYGFTIQQTIDGDYVAAGFSYSIDGDLNGNTIDKNAWILKINSTGKILWQKNLGGIGEEFFYCIQKTKDDGFVLAGFSSKTNENGSGNSDDQDCWIIKLKFESPEKALEVPNAFSPNNDGINDFWNLSFLSNFPQCKVEIFNRYGQMVFNSVGYNKPWDGTFNGKNVPFGTYYYIIDRGNEMQKIAGWLVVLR